MIRFEFLDGLFGILGFEKFDLIFGHSECLFNV